MLLSALVSQVQSSLELQGVYVPRETIVSRAREAWPQTIDFRDVQVRLLADRMALEGRPKMRRSTEKPRLLVMQQSQRKRPAGGSGRG